MTVSGDPALLALFAERNLGVLTTIKRDGRPQLSNVTILYDANAELLKVSVTDGRAKVANLRRDPRASLMVSTPEGWSYAVAEGVAVLSDVAAAPDDATVDELVDLYRRASGREHPDWDEYRAVMVQDKRLVLRLPIDRVYGIRQNR